MCWITKGKMGVHPNYKGTSVSIHGTNRPFRMACHCKELVKTQEQGGSSHLYAHKSATPSAKLTRPVSLHITMFNVLAESVFNAVNFDEVTLLSPLSRGRVSLLHPDRMWTHDHLQSVRTHPSSIATFGTPFSDGAHCRPWKMRQTLGDWS